MPKASGDDRAKVKLRVIEFELEGGNASVENSIRQLTHAIVISKSNGAGQKPLPAKTPTALPVPADEDEQAETVEAEFTDNTDNSDAPPPAPRARTPRKAPAMPDPIEVDLTSGDMPFKQFCDERSINATSTDSKKYLLAAVWMKEYRNTPAIEAGHIYSIFKMMKWNLPTDIGAPLRGMKKQKWFTTPDRGKFAINHLGENEVNSLTTA